MVKMFKTLAMLYMTVFGLASASENLKEVRHYHC